MGKAPQVVIITRHGARLDAEDSGWHAKSSAPYDTPLSYGGWTQTRALGARIASLLHARDLSLNQEDASSKRRNSDASKNDANSQHRSSSNTRASTKRRKHKVVIHSSPFLRCIQSSIAISAGMAQYETNLARFEKSESTHSVSQRGLYAGPLRSKTLDSKQLEARYAASRAVDRSKTSSHDPEAAEPVFRKNTLRVDGCLGEWLSPEYYEFITAPPKSKMMVAGAKAELLRAAPSIIGSGGTQSPIDATKSSSHNGPSGSAFSMEELNESLKKHGLTKSFTPGEDGQKKNEAKQAEIPSRQSTTIGYIPPAPSYALSGSQPIPQGYVAHARDACVQIDFSWDSIYPPQDWGDGGEYGEEWSSMHRRFRKCIMSMISWYTLNGAYCEPQDTENSYETTKDQGQDIDEDIVLILVTHSAGANALIGALTNQPVLLDVGMGSLTMAIHKKAVDSLPVKIPSPNQNLPNPLGRRRRSSVDLGLSDQYDMKVIASTEHLRAGADPLQIPQLLSPNLMPSIAESRGSSPGASGQSTPSLDYFDRPKSRHSALGSSIRRNSLAVATPSPLATSPSTPTGLWGGGGGPSGGTSTRSSSRRATINNVEDDANSSIDGDFPVSSANSVGSDPRSRRSSHNIGSKTPTWETQSAGAGTVPTRSGSQHGLWGASSTLRMTSINKNN